MTQQPSTLNEIDTQIEELRRRKEELAREERERNEETARQAAARKLEERNAAIITRATRAGEEIRKHLPANTAIEVTRSWEGAHIVFVLEGHVTDVDYVQQRISTKWSSKPTGKFFLRVRRGGDKAVIFHDSEKNGVNGEKIATAIMDNYNDVRRRDAAMKRLRKNQARANELVDELCARHNASRSEYSHGLGVSLEGNTNETKSVTVEFKGHYTPDEARVIYEALAATGLLFIQSARS